MLDFITSVTESQSYNNFSMKEKSPVAKINLRGNLENKDFASKVGKILEEGAQIVEEVKRNPPMDMIGHVTSSYYSPNLNKSIALAVVKNGKKLKGKKLFIPMQNKTIEVTVSDTVFLDKEGDRLNA